jgi:RimJ/RimL family protein N-acetyltransferase
MPLTGTLAELGCPQQLEQWMILSVPDPESGLPIGPIVPDVATCRPARVSLDGRFVRLRPLDADRDLAALWQETHGPDQAQRWQYLLEPPFADQAAFLDHLRRKAASDDPLFFTIADRLSERALGYATLMRIEPAHRCVEVGNVVYGAGLQRSPGATEAQYLLMRYVFDDLRNRRYEWKCNALNAPSRRAAVRLGFTFEGVFRQHMIVRGRSRDTAWYAIVDSDWGAIKAAFEQWLAPANFDAQGRQVHTLEALRATR